MKLRPFPVKPARRRKPRAYVPLEKDTQAAIVQYLRLAGAFIIRVNSGAMQGEHNGRKRFVRFNSEPGCSDLLAILPDGRFAAIECKRSNWTPRDTAEPTTATSKRNRHERRQAEFLAAVRGKGGIGIFATGIDDVRRALIEYGYDAP